MGRLHELLTNNVSLHPIHAIDPGFRVFMFPSRTIHAWPQVLVTGLGD
jgi:hypothetical protein